MFSTLSQRFFNTTGPCNQDKHFMLPPEERLVGAQLHRYIKHELYWVLLIFILVFASCNEDEKPQEEKTDLLEMTDVEVSANDQNFVVVKSGDEKFTFTVPLGFDLLLLSKTKVVFKLSEGAYSDRLSGSELNFTSVESINITITAADKSTKVYTIEKNVELYSDAKILAFALNIGTEKFEGVVNDTEGKVTLTVPYRLKNGLATAIPQFSTSPSAIVDFASGVARDFSNPVIYEVTSQDNTKRTWEVIVTIEAPSTENDIIDFKFKINNDVLEGEINKNNHTVSIFVTGSLYFHYKSGIPTIVVSEFATVTPSSGTLTFIGESPYTFTYTVTAQDGETSQQWTVVITVEEICLTDPPPGCPNYIPPEFFPGEIKPPTFINCFQGAYYRKAVSSRDNKWRGIVTKVVLPEIHFDLDRPHSTRPQQYLDNFSVYLGGNASGQETDIGLTWEVIRLPNGTVTADRRAFRPFWRTTRFGGHEIPWANADAQNTNFHYYPGDTLILSLVFVSERMVRFDVIGQGPIAHKQFSTLIECRGFTSTALTEYKRVNAIDQMNNEGRPVQPTKAKAVGLEWLETNLLRLEGTDIVTVPMHSGRFTDMRCPQVTHIEVIASDEDKKIGAEKVNIYGTP